jgi:hypothetical protein
MLQALDKEATSYHYIFDAREKMTAKSYHLLSFDHSYSNHIVLRSMSCIKYDYHYHYVGNTQDPIIPGILIGVL